MLPCGRNYGHSAGLVLLRLCKDAPQRFRFFFELFRVAAADQLHKLGVNAIFLAVAFTFKGVALVLQLLAVGFQLGLFGVQLGGGIVGSARSLALRPLTCQTILNDGVYFFLGEHLPGGAVSLRRSVCLLGGVRGVVVGHGDFLSRPDACGRYSDAPANAGKIDTGNRSKRFPLEHLRKCGEYKQKRAQRKACLLFPALYS